MSLYVTESFYPFVTLCYRVLPKYFFQPKTLRSPTWVVHFQSGNSFECATLLVSLLLGQNYNAFVVSGYASREQALYDMTRKNCPYLEGRLESEIMSPQAAVSDTVNNRYRLKAPSNFKSQFLLKLEDRERKRIEDELERQREEEQKRIAVCTRHQ